MPIEIISKATFAESYSLTLDELIVKGNEEYDDGVKEVRLPVALTPQTLTEMYVVVPIHLPSI